MASRDPDADDIDFFPTPPWAARAGAELILELDPRAADGVWWEPACGAGHMAHGLAPYCRRLFASDLCDYTGNALFDFAQADTQPPVAADWIVSNPPFTKAEDFIRLGLARARRGVALLMRAAILESEGRYPLLTRDCPLTVFAPFSERVPMVKGRWDPAKSSASFYAWFIFRRTRGPMRPPVVRFIPPGTRTR